MTTVRRLRFEYPADMDPIWTPAHPEFACAANSVSLMMPIIEPYFVRSAARILSLLPLDQRAEAEDYVAQESQHHRQHRIFNRMLLAHHPALARVERWLEAVYRRLERSRSDRFNLAFAVASETMAYSAARWAAEHRTELFRSADDVAATLFLWHLAEEVEHKSAAFELYRTVHGDTPGARRAHVGAMVVALLLVTTFVFLGTSVMLADIGRLHHPVAWARLIRWSFGFALEMLTNLALSVLGGHHPDDLVDPVWYEVWLREFDQETNTMPVWHTGSTERSRPA